MIVKDLLVVLHDAAIRIESWEGKELYKGHQDNTFRYLINNEVESLNYNEKDHIYIITVEQEIQR